MPSTPGRTQQLLDRRDQLKAQLAEVGETCAHAPSSSAIAATASPTATGSARARTVTARRGRERPEVMRCTTADAQGDLARGGPKWGTAAFMAEVLAESDALHPDGINLPRRTLPRGSLAWRVERPTLSVLSA